MAVPLSCKDLRPEAHLLFRLWSGKIKRQTRKSSMSVQKIAEETDLSWEEIRAVSQELDDDGYIKLNEYSSALILAPVCCCSEEDLTACGITHPCEHARVSSRAKALEQPSKAHSSLGTTSPEAPKAPDFEKRPVQEWAWKEFAQYLGRQLVKRYRYGNGFGFGGPGPQPVSFRLLAKHIREWVLNGTDPTVVKRMIEIFASDPKSYMRRGKPAWVSFVLCRQQLFERASDLVRMDLMAEHGEDREFLLSQGVWAKPPVYGPEWDDRDVLEGRKRR